MVPMNLANHVRVASKDKKEDKKESRVVSKMTSTQDAAKRKLLKKRFAQMEKSEEYGEV